MSTAVTPLIGVRTAEKPRLDRPPTPTTTKSTLECLIVSTNTLRREQLSRAATDNGWATVVCGDADTARHLANRIALKLAIVDLERPSPAESGKLRELSAELSQTGGPLLVVCGAEGDAPQEIWARQLGAWLYLSEIAGDDAMALICNEARLVVEKSNSDLFAP